MLAPIEIAALSGQAPLVEMLRVEHRQTIEDQHV
jgi:hypothetical protein